jgi:hypothetical protein
MLCGNVLDGTRAEEAWKSLLQPYQVSSFQVSKILFGSQKKEVQTTLSMKSRYNINDFSPEYTEDIELIQFLKHHLIY